MDFLLDDLNSIRFGHEINVATSVGRLREIELVERIIGIWIPIAVGTMDLATKSIGIGCGCS